MYGVLKENTETIEVEAGTFISNRNEVYTILESSGDISPGRNNYYFSNGIGEILKKISLEANKT